MSAACPYLVTTPAGETSIDFADPAAVKCLNRALLGLWYGLRDWDIPEGYLCPPIPGRADYVHCVADLLRQSGGGQAPARTRMLDVGTGASAIYVLIGRAEYGWDCVGSDIDKPALDNAAAILRANPSLAEGIALRVQRKSQQVFDGIWRQGERFEVVMCNPPFHLSADEAAKATERKWRHLGKGKEERRGVLNFGGRADELWCQGGEVAFIGRMAEESRRYARQCLWFTSLVSREDNLPAIRRAVKDAGARHSKVVTMGQGQKRSRFVAWTFLDKAAHLEWVKQSVAAAKQGV